nr:histidine phosphatase family protein [Novosphingobium sp. SG720]
MAAGPVAGSHGETAGNLARTLALQAGHHRIDLAQRDVDVPLSPLGEEQARTLVRWFGSGAEEEYPDTILASPYKRAVDTAPLFPRRRRLQPRNQHLHRERLREKEFGILDGLTAEGIRACHPEQARFREVLGKFYHRPPGGESWVDVAFRLRALLDTVSLHYAGQRVMIVAHQVVILCLRYILEQKDEAQILAIDAVGDIANCSVTEYGFDPTTCRLVLQKYNALAPMLREGTPAT